MCIVMKSEADRIAAKDRIDIGEVMRRNRSNPKRGAEPGIMFL